VIYFTRHGESTANVAERVGERVTVDTDRLSELGWEQARGVGERLRGEGIETIVASHYRRAQETAQAIGEVLGLDVVTDPDMHEVLQSDAYWSASPDYAGTGNISWMPAAEPGFAEPGAESFAELVGRARRVRARLEQRRVDENVLCVSHWGFLHVFLGLTLFGDDFAPAHLPPLYRISHANTGITIFERHTEREIDGVAFDGWTLTTWNDQDHL
jgi:broad specificity phosphatase PhoE